MRSVLSNPQTQVEVGYRELLKPVTIPRCNPQFFVSNSLEQNYLKKLATSGKNFTLSAGIISLSNVDVTFPIGMHLWNGNVFEEAFLSNALFINPKYIIDLELIRFKRKRLASESVLISMPWHHNFYHWLVEILPRLQLYDTSKNLQKLPLIVPNSSPQFVKDSLILTGYIDQVVFVDDAVYRFEKLHLLTKLSDSFDVSPLAIEWLNTKIPNNQFSQKKRIYVSRRDAKIRYVTNEMEVERVLFELGFETIVMSQYSLKQQIEIFQQAEVIVGSHGAAFANLVFTKPEATFIEFFEQGHFNNAYYRIAGLKKMKYGFMVGKKDSLGFYINTDELRTLLEKALSSRSFNIFQKQPILANKAGKS